MSKKKRTLLFGKDDIKQLSFFRKIYLKWNFDWRYLHRDILIGFKNFWKWKGIIWNDRNWDWTALLLILKTKLDLMSEYHNRRKFYEGYDNNVKWMNTCSKLITHIIDEKWEREFYDYYDIEVYEVEGEDIPEGFTEMQTEVVWETINDYIDLYPLQLEVIKKQFLQIKKRKIDFNSIDDKRLFGSLLSNHNQQRATNLLFTIMSTQLRKWWD